MPDKPDRVRVRLGNGPEFDMSREDFDDAMALREVVRARLTEAMAVLDAYGQPDHDPRVTAARDQLAALDDVDQADAPAPARTRRARP